MTAGPYDSRTMKLKTATSVSLIVMGTLLFAVPMVAHMVRSAQAAFVDDHDVFREMTSIAGAERWACYLFGAVMVLFGALSGRASSDG